MLNTVIPALNSVASITLKVENNVLRITTAPIIVAQATLAPRTRIQVVMHLGWGAKCPGEQIGVHYIW